jgi:ABC-2 type transport system ATP-binding protein
MSAILKCEALSKEFGNIHAVNDVSMELQQGAVLAVVGPNGAGKSTWLQMLAGLLPPTSGEAWVAGVSIQEKTREAHEQIGYLPDFYGISGNLLVRDYLKYFALCYKLSEDEIPARVDSIAKKLNLDHLSGRFVRELSRGQKQRVAIGRALINNPRLLLLDEPAAGLDPGARIEFNELVTKLAAEEGMTIVVSSHILTELEDYSSHVAIFEAGKLVLFEDLKKRGQQKSERRIICKFSSSKSPEDFLRSSDLFYKPLSSSVYEITLAGSDAEAADLLAKLSAAKLGLFHFETIETRIEDTYLKTFSKGEA